MSINPTLAIFDFCDTLFDGQTIAYFIKFLQSILPPQKRITIKIWNKLNSIPSTDSKRHKEYFLKPYKGIEENEFETLSKEFFEKIILKKMHRQVLEKLETHKRAGHTIVIASGAFENYLKLFTASFGVDYLFCSKLQFRNSRFTGLIEGNECLGTEKMLRVKTFFGDFDVDWNNSFVYSDHRNDLPLFEMVGNKIIVQNRQPLDWLSNRNGFQILRIDNN